MSEPLILHVGGQLLYTVDFTAEVPPGASVTGIAFSVPAPLQSFVITPDLSNRRSTIGLQGATHGGLWLVRATATLNNQEQIAKSFSVRGFNG